MSLRHLPFVVLTSLALAGPALAQQLVTLPVGSSVSDVTPDGEIVAGSWNFGDGFIWRWRVDPSPTVILGGTISGISDDGTVACGNITSGPAESTAGIWTAATGWQTLGFVAGTPEGCGSLSSAYDISGDGTTIVGLAWIDGCDGAGFRWTASTGLEPLQHLANGHNRCSAISGDGSVLGGFAQGTFSRTPAYWNADTSGAVLDPNHQGEVYNFTEDGGLSVGTLGFPSVSPYYRAFLRDGQTGAITNLGSLHADWAAAASDLSEDAGVIVGFDYISLSRQAWVWTNVDGMIALKQRLTALGLTGVPELLVCNAVSDDGTVVGGTAVAGGGGPFGFGGFIVDLPRPTSQWTNLLGGLSGTAGVPKLVGTGPLTGGSLTSIVLTQGKPLAPAAYVVGLSAANLPFKQGVLVPFPNQIVMIPSLSSHGAVSLSFNWPGGVPGGVALYWQGLVSDSAAPAGVALSNALQSLTP